MVISRAYTKYIRISPRKLRQAIDLIRGERATKALVVLANLNKKARICVEKTLKSAISNAKQNPSINTDELFISKITADKGPMLKRFRAAAMGRATMIRHRTAHLAVELSELAVKKPKIVKKASKQKSTGKTPAVRTKQTKEKTKPKRRIRR